MPASQIMQPAGDQWGQQPQQLGFQQPVAPQPAPVIMGQPTVGLGVPGIMNAPVTQATTALILAILGLVVCSICTAIPGLIMANGALVITNQYPGHPDAGTAKAAQVISWVVIALTTAAVVIYGGLAVLMILASVAESNY